MTGRTTAPSPLGRRIAQLLRDLQRPMGVWPESQDVKGWQVWTVATPSDSGYRLVYVGRWRKGS